MCFTSEELEGKSSAVHFFSTKAKFDLLYFRPTCKKAHRRVFNTHRHNGTSLLINFHSHFHLLSGTILSLQKGRIYYNTRPQTCNALPCSLPFPCSSLRRNKGIEPNFSCGLGLRYQKECLLVICRTTCETRAILCSQAPPRSRNCTILEKAQSCPMVYLHFPAAGPSAGRVLGNVSAGTGCILQGGWLLSVCFFSQHFKIFCCFKERQRNRIKIFPRWQPQDEKVLPFLTLWFVESFLLFCCFNLILLACSQWTCFPHMWIFFFYKPRLHHCYLDVKGLFLFLPWSIMLVWSIKHTFMCSPSKGQHKSIMLFDHFVLPRGRSSRIFPYIWGKW